MKLINIYNQILWESQNKDVLNLIKNIVPKSTEIYDDYRVVNPDITKDNFFIATKGTFDLFNGNWNDIDSTEIRSPKSSSVYKVKNGMVYRKSNHWGQVASCYWELNGIKDGEYQIGRIKLSDLRPNDRSGGYIDFYPNAMSKINSAIKSLNDIKVDSKKIQILIRDEMNKLNKWKTNILNRDDSKVESKIK